MTRENVRGKWCVEQNKVGKTCQKHQPCTSGKDEEEDMYT